MPNARRQRTQQFHRVPITDGEAALADEEFEAARSAGLPTERHAPIPRAAGIGRGEAEVEAQVEGAILARPAADRQRLSERVRQVIAGKIDAGASAARVDVAKRAL